MQFDEKDSDNNSFSLDEGNSISWEDLLNTDEDIDLSALIKDDSIAKNITETDNKKTQTEESEKKQDTFDLSAATSSYVNSLEADEAGITPDSQPKNDDFVSISQDGSAQNSGGKTIDDLLTSISDDDFSTIDDNVVIPDEKIASVVDDELLSLLDTNNDAEISVNKEEVLKAKDEDDILSELDVASNDTVGDLSPSVKVPLDDEDDGSNSYEEEVYLEEDEQEEANSSKGNKVPVVLFVIIALVGLFAAIYLSLIFFFNENSATGDIAGAPESSYTIKDFQQETATQKDEMATTASGEEIAVEENKETEELVDKIENSKQPSKEKEEKVLVTVPVSGRKNPFVPSSLFDANGFAGFGADITAPPDGNLEVPEAAAARKLLSIVVSGIMFDAIKPSAILKFDNRDYFVQKGDRIDDYTVKQITKDYVAINNGANVYKAYVGEAFNIKEELPGSNRVTIQNGKRQYVSRDDIEISTR